MDVDIRGLRDSGIPEPYTDGFMYESMQELAKYDGNVVANFHPENIELVETVAPKVKAAGEMGLAAWDHVRPEIAEAETVSRLSYFSEKTGCPLYCVHISCAEAAEKIAQGKKTNLRLYGETTPHYLVLNTDSPWCRAWQGQPPAARGAQQRQALAASRGRHARHRRLRQLRQRPCRQGRHDLGCRLRLPRNWHDAPRPPQRGLP